jgi:hypothetical protein
VGHFETVDEYVTPRLKHQAAFGQGAPRSNGMSLDGSYSTSFANRWPIHSATFTLTALPTSFQRLS